MARSDIAVGGASVCRGAAFEVIVHAVKKPASDKEWAARFVPVPQDLEALRDGDGYWSPASAKRLVDEAGRVWNRPEFDASLVDRCLARGCPMYVFSLGGQDFMEVSRVPNELAKQFWADVQHRLVVDDDPRDREDRTLEAVIWYDAPKVKRKKGAPPAEAVVLLDFGYC